MYKIIHLCIFTLYCASTSLDLKFRQLVLYQIISKRFIFHNFYLRFIVYLRCKNDEKGLTKLNIEDRLKVFQQISCALQVSSSPSWYLLPFMTDCITIYVANAIPDKGVSNYVDLQIWKPMGILCSRTSWICLYIKIRVSFVEQHNRDGQNRQLWDLNPRG